MLDLCEDVNTMIRMQVKCWILHHLHILVNSWFSKNICRQSRTCPTCAGILRSRLFPRLPTSSLNCCRWFCHQQGKMENWNENQIRARTVGKSLWSRTRSWPWSEGTPRPPSSAFSARSSNVFFSLRDLCDTKLWEANQFSLWRFTLVRK